jgi:hypothetical protein
MAQFKIRLIILAIVAAAAVSHRITPNVSITQVITPLTQHVSADTRFVLVKRFTHVNSTNITTNAPKNVPTRTDADADGADAVRTAVTVSSREWITDILNTVVMALLGLASIIVAVVLGRKQLRAMRPHISQLEMNDLENGQHDLDGDRTEGRPDITSADPSAQQADSFLPEPQPHVVPNDQPPTRLRVNEQADIDPRRLARQCGGEGQMHGKVMPAAGSCIQLDRQDSQTRDLHDRESHFQITKSIG